MMRRRAWAALAIAAALLPWGTRHPVQGAARVGPAVIAFGDAGSHGDPTTLRPNRPVVGMASTPDGGGYWLVASDGGIFAFGNAAFRGSMGGTPLNRPVVGMASTPDGGGYWLVASDGGIFSFGNAGFHGSTGALRLNRPVVGMASTPDGGGYWLVASDGGIFAFGNAAFHGSMGGTPLNRPVVGMASTPDGGGYWLVASDGGIFAFGNAAFHGSAAGTLGATRVAAALSPTPTGRGYDILAVPAAMRVGFAGDVHGVSRVGAYLATGGNPLTPMAPLFAANDVNLVNLETAVGSQGAPAAKQYTFQSPTSLLTALRAAGVHVVSLANNHSLDYGRAALLETIDNVRAAGLVPVGAGADAAQAYAPAYVSTPGGTLGIVGLSQVVQAGWAAGPGRPGVASAYDLNATTAAVRAARANADHVVVMVHWGTENTDCPNGKQASLGATLLQAGADAVVGHHPHRLQGVTAANGRLVAYSMGNFVWYNHAPPNDLTGLLSVELDATGVRGYDFAPARIDGHGRPLPLTGQAAADAVTHLASLTPGAGRC